MASPVVAPPSLLVKQQPSIGKRPRSDEQGSSSSTTSNGNRSTGTGGKRGGPPRKDVPRKDVPRKDVPRKDVPRKDVPRKDVPRKEVKVHATCSFACVLGHCCMLACLLWILSCLLLFILQYSSTSYAVLVVYNRTINNSTVLIVVILVRV